MLEIQSLPDLQAYFRIRDLNPTLLEFFYKNYPQHNESSCSKIPQEVLATTLETDSKEKSKENSEWMNQIVAAVGADASAQEREKAALRTRKPKGEEILREELQAYWRSEAQAIGLQHPTRKFFKGSRQKASQAVDEAIAHCSERKVNFSRENIEKFVFDELGQGSWNDIQKSIDQNQNLLKAKDNEYTTLSAVNRELDSIRLVNRGKNRVRRIASINKIKERLEDRGFTEGQHKAIVNAATTKDRFVAWQGKAGVGKTYALSEYKRIAEELGYKVKGFAPSAAAAGVLGSELGVEGNTVTRLLISKSREEAKRECEKWVRKNFNRLYAKHMGRC